MHVDKKDPSYQDRIRELQKMADEGIRHPKGVFGFKTFEEFNEFKEIFKKSTGGECPKNDVARGPKAR